MQMQAKAHQLTLWKATTALAVSPADSVTVRCWSGWASAQDQGEMAHGQAR